MHYLNVVPQLVSRVPEFAETEHDWNADLPHDAFGSFAQFLCTQIQQGTTDELLMRAFNLLNEMASSADEDVIDLLVVSVLEIIADDDECRTKAHAYLSDHGKVL